MEFNKILWTLIGLLGLSTAVGTYSCRHLSGGEGTHVRSGTLESEPQPAGFATSRSSISDPMAGSSFETKAPSPSDETAEAKRRSAETREAVARAIRDSVRKMRESPQAYPQDKPPAGLDHDRNMPLVEMTWEQYRGWAKYAGALARRDYKGVDRMVSQMEELFGPEIAAEMVNAFVEDYNEYLQNVITTNCEGYEPESVWRKTMYMPFVLARMNRSSAHLDQRTTEARTICGFEA